MISTLVSGRVRFKRRGLQGHVPIAVIEKVEQSFAFIDVLGPSAKLSRRNCTKSVKFIGSNCVKKHNDQMTISFPARGE